MIVIHPYDPTTTFLKPLYENKAGVELYTQKDSNSTIRRALNRRVYDGETVMMLGHGWGQGLLADSSPAYKYDRLIINSSHVEFLRKVNCIGIWCNADVFAEKYKLKGIFTGMIISESQEAAMFKIPATEKELIVENARLTELFIKTLQECPQLSDIPAWFRTHAPMHTPLQRFNYNNIHYFTGED